MPDHGVDTERRFSKREFCLTGMRLLASLHTRGCCLHAGMTRRQMCGQLSPQWASAETQLAFVSSGTVSLPLAVMTDRCISVPLKLTTRRRTSGRRCVQIQLYTKAYPQNPVRSCQVVPLAALPGFLPCFRYVNVLLPHANIALATAAVRERGDKMEWSHSSEVY